MKIFEAQAAVDDAKATLRAADVVANSLVELLVGRLRTCRNGYALGQLKRELRGFDLRRARWGKP